MAKPIARISKGRFSPEKYGPVKRLIEQSRATRTSYSWLAGPQKRQSRWTAFKPCSRSGRSQGARASLSTRLRIMSHCGKSNLLGAADCLGRGP